MNRERLADYIFQRKYSTVEAMYLCRNGRAIKLELEELGTLSPTQVFVPYNQFRQLGIRKDDVVRHSPWGFIENMSIKNGD